MQRYWLIDGLKVRPATAEDYPAVSAFYDLVIDRVSGTEFDVLWSKEVHPTEEWLQDACASGQMMVGEQNGQLVACGIIDGEGGDGYSTIQWPSGFSDDEAMVLHLFCTHPDIRHQRIGSRMLWGIACEANLRGKHVIRVDVLEHVQNAQRLYESMGFEFVCSSDQIYVDPLVKGRIAEMYEWVLPKRERLLVSACLLGEPCRYDGKSCPVEPVQRLEKSFDLVPVCPEQMGGLDTPRVPCELQPDGRVLSRDGGDRTAAYQAGAQAALELARETGCTRAVLKSKSPSCGVHEVYDGNFSGSLTAGCGMTACVLADAGLQLLDETGVGVKAGLANAGEEADSQIESAPAESRPDLSWCRKELNLRDLGGYVGAGGRKVKSGLLFRSAALGEATLEELEGIKALGLRYILDLRCAEEAEELPDPEIPGAKQLRISGAMDANGNEINLSPRSMYRLLFNPRRYDPDPEDSILSAIAEVYTSLAFNSIAYRNMMEHLERGVAPILFHCTAGKDRTGIGAIVILMALGVDEKTIVEDFVLTNEYRKSIIESRLRKHPALAKLSLYRLFVNLTEGVLESFGTRVLDEIRQEYGTLDVYLEKEFGLVGERLERFRDMYLEPAGA